MCSHSFLHVTVSVLYSQNYISCGGNISQTLSTSEFLVRLSDFKRIPDQEQENKIHLYLIPLHAYVKFCKICPFNISLSNTAVFRFAVLKMPPNPTHQITAISRLSPNCLNVCLFVPQSLS